MVQTEISAEFLSTVCSTDVSFYNIQFAIFLIDKK